MLRPKWLRSIQRDRDLETFHRGMQYRRAIQLYYRKFHAYPPNVEALVNTNDIRFLRKKYIDPMTGQDDWKPIAFGQNKTPTAMGFFGQPLAGNASTLAGIGPGGVGGLPGSTNSTGGSSDGGFSSGGFSSGSSDISNDQSSATSGSGLAGSPSDSSGNTTGGAGSTGSTSSSGTSSTSSSTSGSSGPIIGGAGIIGFEPASPKQSILVYKKKNHYNEWEFTYDPLSDLKMIGSGSTGLEWPTRDRQHHTREYANFRFHPDPWFQPNSSTGAARHHPAIAHLAPPHRRKRPAVSGEPLLSSESLVPASYAWNDEPHPQVDFTWGLSNLNPAASSVST